MNTFSLNTFKWSILLFKTFLLNEEVRNLGQANIECEGINLFVKAQPSP